ncbi:hypothetical protein GQ37_005190 [Janthinobacterium sp. BJB1]|uniref:hypothetical protein n=1 Tax=Janthinobacterium sp. GW458P TaxID=1981504 RepID=UPI000C0E7D60|nr:hypothetical protein [Janthinobacterium sp. GW458P]MBE3024863.1 hypothetical protein [Janthinobacterium sp. GW458P]PJC99715.1 hypothetical protein GQ37_005190 [Janthinobacterium sp. BJB1]
MLKEVMSNGSHATCPKCHASAQVRHKKILIGKASPRALFCDEGEERAGYRRADQLAIDECTAAALGKAPLEQFLDGYYCGGCDVGFVADSVRQRFTQIL